MRSWEEIEKETAEIYKRSEKLQKDYWNWKKEKEAKRKYFEEENEEIEKELDRLNEETNQRIQRNKEIKENERNN